MITQWYHRLLLCSSTLALPLGYSHGNLLWLPSLWIAWLVGLLIGYSHILSSLELLLDLIFNYLILIRACANLTVPEGGIKGGFGSRL